MIIIYEQHTVTTFKIIRCLMWCGSSQVGEMGGFAAGEVAFSILPPACDDDFDDDYDDDDYHHNNHDDQVGGQIGDLGGRMGGKLGAKAGKKFW